LKTVLLAIQGAKPHQSVMSFAVQFCRRMHVALDVVHFVRPEQDFKPVSNPCPNEGDSAGKESVSGCRDSHLLKSENPTKAIANYIDTHRNIVLAIYDVQTGNRNITDKTQTGAHIPMGFDKPLGVPLVVMRA
jgi:hypothetical protein